MFFHSAVILSLSLCTLLENEEDDSDDEEKNKILKRIEKEGFLKVDSLWSLLSQMDGL